MTTTADWAHLYARYGWRVFPANPERKTPLYRNWLADATTEPSLVEQYFGGLPDRNIGLICGEAFDAWDIEGDHVAAFSAAMYERGATLPPETPIASTGRGGLHLLTRPTGVDGSRNLYLGGTHIGELKSRGGFIIACPSEVRYDGVAETGTYVWLTLTPNLSEPNDFLRGLLERPTTLRKTLPTRITSPDDAVAVLGRLAGSVTHAGEGRRNNYLYWAVRRAVEEGIPVAHAVKAMAAAAREAGLDEDETEKTIESAIGAESVAA